MRVLTVRQPWALHIVQSGKDVENRSRNLAGSYRGPLAIHSALKADDDALRRLPQKAPNGIPRIFRYGVIIGVVDLVGVHIADSCLREVRSSNWEDDPDFEACSDWADGIDRDTVHLELANPRRLREPIPYRGALYLQTASPELEAQIWAGVAA